MAKMTREEMEKICMECKTMQKVKKNNDSTKNQKWNSGKPYREKMVFTRELKGGVYC